MMLFKMNTTALLYTVFVVVRCWESRLILTSVDDFYHQGGAVSLILGA